MANKAEIHFHSDKPIAWFRKRNALRDAIEDLFQKERKRLQSLHIIFVSDKELLAMNQQYLRHNTYTDIISFDLAAAGGATQGELYISIDRVEANAEKFDVPKSQELRRVIFHGCLHLCGYKDKLKKDIAVIRKKEDEYLHRYLSK